MIFTPMHHASFFRELVNGWADLVWPRFCYFCNARIKPEATNSSICEGCPILAATMQDEECPRCSSTIGPYTRDESGCTRCRNHRFAFEQAIRLGRYTGELREAILHLKTNVDEVLGESMGQKLGEKLLERIDVTQIDFVIPVPLHWRRRLSRGYNQCEPIARGVAHTLKKPLKLSGLSRRVPTSRQRDHAPTQRWTNVRGVFQAHESKEMRDRTVLLIDDVLTTGATASSAASELRQKGVKAALIAILAHES